jgi:hypothetical protein
MFLDRTSWHWELVTKELPHLMVNRKLEVRGGTRAQV